MEDNQVFKSFIAKTPFGHDMEFFYRDLHGQRMLENKSPQMDVFTALSSLFECMPEKRCCLDIGANVGLHTAFYSRDFEIVYAFEPNPYVYAALKNNIERNGLAAEAFNMGISDQDAELNFNIVTSGNFGLSTFNSEVLPSGAEVMEIKAPVTTGDGFLAQRQTGGVDYVKIDVEGLEARVISGLEKTIMKDQPVINLEWNNESTRREFAERELFSTVLSGYTPFALGRASHRDASSGIAGGLKRLYLKTLGKAQGQRLRWMPFKSSRIHETVLLLPQKFLPVFESRLRNLIY